MLSTSISGTLQWQPSATPLCPTLYSKGCMKCPSPKALPLANMAKWVRIVWLMQTLSTTMISHFSTTAILLNVLGSASNSLCSGNICHMLQQRNWMELRNMSAPRWNHATSSWMNRYFSSILSLLRWFWPLQLLRQPLGATFVPLFGSSDLTQLTNHSGDKKECPVYLSLGNIDSTIRSKTSNVACIPVALPPVPVKYHLQGHGQATAMKNQQIQNQEVFRVVFKRIFRSLHALFNTALFMLGADGRMRQYYRYICAWRAG